MYSAWRSIVFPLFIQVLLATNFDRISVWRDKGAWRGIIALNGDHGLEVTKLESSLFKLMLALLGEAFEAASMGAEIEALKIKKVGLIRQAGAAQKGHSRRLPPQK